MNRRLRRKKHVGEFKELGFSINCKLECSEDEFDEWFDAFISIAIEGNGLCCGGGGRKEDLSMFVYKHKGSCTEANRECVEAWLGASECVKEFEVGELKDVWYE